MELKDEDLIRAQVRVMLEHVGPPPPGLADRALARLGSTPRMGQGPWPALAAVLLALAVVAGLVVGSRAMHQKEVPATKATPKVSVPSPKASSSPSPGAASVNVGGVTPATAEQLVAATVTRANPALMPAAVPGDWTAKVEATPDFYSVEYRDPSGARDLTLAVEVPNPPPVSGASLSRPDFRGDVHSEYEVSDPSSSTSARWLMWNEPGTWSLPNGLPGVPYVLTARGLTNGQFWNIAGSLVPVGTNALPNSGGFRAVDELWSPDGSARCRVVTRPQSSTAPWPTSLYISQRGNRFRRVAQLPSIPADVPTLAACDPAAGRVVVVLAHKAHQGNGGAAFIAVTGVMIIDPATGGTTYSHGYAGEFGTWAAASGDGRLLAENVGADIRDLTTGQVVGRLPGGAPLGLSGDSQHTLVALAAGKDRVAEVYDWRAKKVVWHGGKGMLAAIPGADGSILVALQTPAGLEDLVSIGPDGFATPVASGVYLGGSALGPDLTLAGAF